MAVEGRIFGNDIEVSFERLKQNLEKRGYSRLLYQFKNSPVLKQIIQKMSIQMQEAYDAAIEALDKRTLAKAQGVNLDIIGDIVGQKRIGNNLDFIFYFHPDKAGWSVDQAPVWVTNAPLYGHELVDDNVYRRLILAKIFKNHCLCGSILEVRYCAEFISGHRVSLVKTGLQSFKFAFEYGTSINDIILIMKFWKDETIDWSYLLPIPATVFLDEEIVFMLPMDNGYAVGFGPDMYETRPDYAKAALTINVGEYV